MSEVEVRICPLCGGRVFWMPVSLLWVCEHCKNTFNRYTAFPEPKKVEPIGNAAKLREALVCLRDAARKFHHQILNSKYNGILDKYTCEKQGFSAALKVVDAIVKANYAINAPARNCDVGTADEQIDRMLAFCGRKGKCTRCENHKIGTMFRECTLRWAQMPYEKGGDDGSK